MFHSVPHRSKMADCHHLEIKADRQLTRYMLNTPWLLTNGQFQWLLMVIHNYHWLNSASRVLISTCSSPLVQMGEYKQFSPFDLDLWPTTLTNNRTLAKVNILMHAKCNHQATSIGQYWQHIATETNICRLLAHTCNGEARKLQLVYLWLTYYADKFAANIQQIKTMELQP